jgi:hypothetical protein
VVSAEPVQPFFGMTNLSTAITLAVGVRQFTQ